MGGGELNPYWRFALVTRSMDTRTALQYVQGTHIKNIRNTKQYDTILYKLKILSIKRVILTKRHVKFNAENVKLDVAARDFRL